MGSPSGIVELPPEILSLIMEHITDRPTLLSLCRSCSTLCREAEVHLYTSIDTRKTHHHAQFLSTITRNSRLASLVRSYRNHDFDYWFDHHFGQILKQGLQSMTKLKDLDIAISRIAKAQTEFFKQCEFQLESFALRDGRIRDWESMVSFLRQQTSLKHLVMATMESGMCLPPDTCQKIWSLSGSFRVLESFLPGRNITTLNWIPDRHEIFTLEAGSRLAGSFNQLRFLSIGGHSSRPHLSGIAEHLCLLEVLELFLLKTGELPLLPKLPRLNNLIISSGAEDSIPGVSIEDRAKYVVNRIFTSCAAMRRVDIQYKRTGNHDFYICWIDNMRQDRLEWKGRIRWERIY